MRLNDFVITQLLDVSDVVFAGSNGEGDIRPAFLAVRPGHPDTVVATVINSWVGGSKLVSFVGTVRHVNEGHGGVIGFTDDHTIYEGGYGGVLAGHTFAEDGSISFDPVMYGASEGTTAAVDLVSRKLHFASGIVVEPSVPTVAGTMANTSLTAVEDDEATGRSYALGSGELVERDLTHFRLIKARTLSVNAVGALVRTPNGFVALLGRDGESKPRIVFLNHPRQPFVQVGPERLLDTPPRQPGRPEHGEPGERQGPPAHDPVCEDRWGPDCGGRPQCDGPGCDGHRLPHGVALRHAARERVQPERHRARSDGRQPGAGPSEPVRRGVHLHL